MHDYIFLCDIIIISGKQSIYFTVYFQKAKENLDLFQNEKGSLSFKNYTLIEPITFPI